MANLERQRVRFTGKRTGRDSMPIRGIGVVEVGDVIELDAETAARYTAEGPNRDGDMVSDFSSVGGVFTAEPGVVAKHEMKQQDKYAATAEEALPEEVNTELAHEVVPEYGTVEEMAEVQHLAAEAADDDDKDDDKPKKASSKK